MWGVTERVLVAVMLLTGLSVATVENQGSKSAPFKKDLKDQTSLLENLTTSVSELQHSLAELIRFDHLLALPTSQFNPLTQETDRLATRHSSCQAWQNTDPSSGIRLVEVRQNQFHVYCDQTTDHGGWTVFQRRVDGTVDFFRNWAEYRSGFGDLEGNYWMGLDKLHNITTSEMYELRVELWSWNWTQGYVTYSGFYVDGASDNFVLHFDSKTGGNISDSLNYHNGSSFSTWDRDHDLDTENCAVLWRSAWWFKDCFHCNLNGQYQKESGIMWAFFADNNMRFSEMKMRPM